MRKNRPPTRPSATLSAMRGARDNVALFRACGETVREARMRGAGVFALLLLAAGCSFFGKSKTPSFFSLDRIAPPAVTAARGTPLAISSIELPPGYDRREIVVRKANHQLEIRNMDQWSSTLQPLVLHTLAFDLAARLPEGMVILPGELQPARALRTVDVVIEEFAAGPEARVTLDARWILRETGRPEVSHHEQITTDASLDSASVATGMSQALAVLADRIAAQVATR